MIDVEVIFDAQSIAFATGARSSPGVFTATPPTCKRQKKVKTSGSTGRQFI